MGSYRTLSYGIRGGGPRNQYKRPVCSGLFFCLYPTLPNIGPYKPEKLPFTSLFAVKPGNGFVDDNTIEGNGKPLLGFDGSFLMFNIWRPKNAYSEELHGLTGVAGAPSGS